MGINLKPKDIRTADHLIEAIRELWTERSIKSLREWIAEIETEDDFYRLIQLGDQADLFKYSNILATQAYKRFGTLRSFGWHCGRLMETGKSLEAEERMLGRLQAIGNDSYSPDELASAHQLLLRVFSQLNRLPEAEEQLEKIKDIKGMIWPDLEAFYYVHSGEWEKAEGLLKQAMEEEDSKRHRFVRLGYADVLAMTGRKAESLAVLEEGDAQDPEDWTYRTELVRSYFLLERYEDAIRQITAINENNPFHVHRNYFVYLTAACLYKLEQWDELESWVTAHQETLKGTIYGKNLIRKDEKITKLNLTPKVQKMNYCVPAALALILEAFGKEIGQDEIASHIFDVTGTKLCTTMSYMESLGLEARYFKGSLEVYKQFIDNGLPVLLSMMVENSAHVQTVIGYDDRLQGLIIQDPNDMAPFLLPYSELKATYKMSDSLSMVFLKAEQKHLLPLLDENEHRFFSELYRYLDEEEESEEESPAFIAFLNAHIEERYAAVIGLASLFSEEAKAMHEQWLERLQNEFGETDEEVALLAAHMHYLKDQLPEALARLVHVNGKKSPYALYLKGAIFMKQDAYQQAIPMLKQSIEMDHYQPAAYSRLARCYLEIGKTYQAYKWSKIALDQLPSDIPVQITHGLIQYETGAYEKALERFRKLAEEEPDDEFFVYQMGCCQQQLGKDGEAIKSFEQSIQMDPNQPYPYLRIAEIHMDAEAWPRALKILDKGIGMVETPDVLHVYRGHVSMEQQKFNAAETEYRKALELDPKDFFAVTHIAHALIKQQRFMEASEWMMAHADTEDTSYFIRTASMLWEEWPEFAGKQQALSLLEKGLENRNRERFHALAEKYAECGEEALFRTRVLQKIKEIRSAESDAIVLCLEGQLHEHAENHRYARRLYQQAIEKAEYPQAYYRLGLLEENRGKFEEAIVNYIRCTELDPAFTAARGALMRAYMALDNQAHAFTAAMTIFENDPLELDFEEFFSLVDSEEAVRIISKALVKISEKVPEEWLLSAKAHCAEKEGRLKDADRLFEQAKSVNGAYTSHFEHVEFCERRGNFKRAAALLEDMMVEYPNLKGLYEKYVFMLSKIGKTNEIDKRLKQKLSGEELAIAKMYCADYLALWYEDFEQEEQKGFISKFRHNTRALRTISHIISLYEEAIKRLPDNNRPVMQLASLYLSRGMAKEALDELKPFVERTGNYEAAVMQIQANLQLAEEKESYKLARAAAVQARKLHEQQPFDARVLLLRGEALAAIDETEKALEQYEHVTHLEPYNAEGYIHLMHLLADRRPKEVKGFENRLPEELKDHEWIRLSLGMVYIEANEGKMARGILSSLIQEEPDYLPGYYELARSEMLLGDQQAAKNHLQHLFRMEEGAHYIHTAAEEPLFEPILDELEALIGEYA
ncbi:tetratricopeptide repeat protein [Planococcus shenhongbingii]|uniref:tetratricopeptide repeat protein n=1 Tax=Planococcus shenhongbingii TaxID=3058398 RepID=UPI00261C2C5A|nr:tetratricopeptide repeat protein [Planococcus sp. N016]WKA56830.1 tetratricopeptide repeat protein [Planococcus sp. N016]